MATGPDRGPQPVGDALRRGEAGNRRPRCQARRTARDDRAEMPRPDQRRKPQGDRVHGLCRHCALPVRHAGALGAGLFGSAGRTGHRGGAKPDDPAGSAARSRVHPDRFRTADQGTAGRPFGRRRNRSNDRDRLYLRRPEPPGLRLARQLRYPLEPGTHRPTSAFSSSISGPTWNSRNICVWSSE